jgi:glycosyltransferase involved in cell wall biosynthesis
VRVLVYPHSLEIGGSQLNAVDLAAAVRDRGHDVVVYGEPGPLVDRVAELGLEFIERRPSRVRPGPATALELRRLVRARRIEVVHGWEWPPILEGYAAASPGTGAAVVGSIMSMGVADFLPACVPLTVGTVGLQQATARSRSGAVRLLEPPVDIDQNRPGPFAASFRAAYPVPSGTLQVVVVSRLAVELKLEGILTAIEAVGRLAAERAVRLVIVGDGPARGTVSEAAARVNERVGRKVVLLTGQLPDPRGAYDCADVCLGMGGSALRALAFATPLIVQGEGGFFETCSEETVAQFLADGWYGVANRAAEEAVEHLVKQLDRLLTDADQRAALGWFGGELVRRRFSLGSAAELLETLYEESRQQRPPLGAWTRSGLAALPRLVSYKVSRRISRLRGRSARDDFNARH